MSIFFHIDFNSYFATVEQQANPRLRGKPVGVTGGDRMERTVVGAASVEAKKLGVRTGMSIMEAKKIAPDLILVRGDSDKYLSCTKRFLNILKDYSPSLEVFSIDECFLEISMENVPKVSNVPRLKRGSPQAAKVPKGKEDKDNNQSVFDTFDTFPPFDTYQNLLTLAVEIKSRIRSEIGEWISCSVGISYNKRMAKLAGSLHKPDGLVMIGDEEAAIRVLDQVQLDDICGIGGRIKSRLNNMGVFSFADLRKVPLENLLASFKSYGLVLYNMARGIDHTALIPFYEKEEVKSIGHRLTLDHDTYDPIEIKQTLLKLSELVARRLRKKKLVGKTISLWYRAAFNLEYYQETGNKFYGEGSQTTILATDDGLEIFNGGWTAFLKMWDKERIRMIGISVSNLKPKLPQTVCFLAEEIRKQVITSALDKINNRYGEFTIKRGVLLHTKKMKRMPNPFLSDRRFKI